VENTVQERIVAGTYQTLAFGVVDGDKSEVVAFGKLGDGKVPDGNMVYEIGSITKTFTATLLVQAVFSGRLTLETPVARLLPDLIPSLGGKEITLRRARDAALRPAAGAIQLAAEGCGQSPSPTMMPRS
jgi:serine-type D-Ala-D-Ala carboxypeptidase/endopeptidase